MNVNFTQPNMGKDQFLDLFLFESSQLIEQAEKDLLACEKIKTVRDEELNSIFRAMHTLKSSSAMMGYTELSDFAHRLEDLFGALRGKKEVTFHYPRFLAISFAGVDAIKVALSSIEKDAIDGIPKEVFRDIEQFTKELSTKKNIDTSEQKAQENVNTKALHHETNREKSVKTKKETLKISGAQENKKASVKELNASENLPPFCLHITFKDCKNTENIRGHLLTHTLKKFTDMQVSYPSGLLENSEAAGYIQKNGLHIFFKPKENNADIDTTVKNTLFLNEYSIRPTNTISNLSEIISGNDGTESASAATSKETVRRKAADFMAVRVDKLDELFNLVGEITVSGSLVGGGGISNDTNRLQKESERLEKLISSLQDIVIEMRMVPLEHVFQKMNRTLYSLAGKLGKEIELTITGENIEVDKKITEYLADPLLHLIRNAADHGIESKEERTQAGKRAKGSIKLSAEQVAGEVQITIADDGRGFDLKKIYQKAKELGLVEKPFSEYPEKDLYALAMRPGFTTEEKVTDLSGRGVGMDVVRENISQIGGSVSIESTLGKGTAISLRVPLTISIIGAMQVVVSDTTISVPVNKILETVIPKETETTKNIDGDEIVLLRGKYYPVLRMAKILGLPNHLGNLKDGVFLLVQGHETEACLFFDKILGQKQIVVKPLPELVITDKDCFSGCAILGDGDISFILDVNRMLREYLRRK